MKFIETADLKRGMRLARPIYNKQGVLLFERDSKLSALAIDSVRNFGLLGVYILEPAEPLPPLSQEDIEFERFQTMTVFSIQGEMERLLTNRRQSRLQSIVSLIIKKYGHLDNNINFYQNLRSKDDYVCRHALNTAILCTMITHVLNVKVEEQIQIVTAALLHDIGKLQLEKDDLFKKDVEADNEKIYQTQLRSLDIFEEAFVDGTIMKRICLQTLHAQHEFTVNGKSELEMKFVMGAKILLVANRYDELTAMNLHGESESEVKAIKEFRANPKLYDETVVEALVRSVKILFPGVSVELNTGEKALVLTENRGDVLRPTVLIFRDNSVMDLSSKANADFEIVDVMKTLDNRYIMDIETLKAAGFKVDSE